MLSPTSRRAELRLIFAASVCAWAAGPASRACGPDFPNRYLDATESRMLAPPEANFAREVERISVQLGAASDASVSGRSSHASARESICALGEEAIRSFEQTELPGEGPRSRVRAAYELGRRAAALTDGGDGRSEAGRQAAREDAVKWFRVTRALVAGGEVDDENLARESIGWEAFAEFHTGNFIPAISLYLEHHRRGDPTAINSLRFVMRRMFRDDTWMKNGLGEKLADDLPARQVWTAWLLAQSDPYSDWESSDHLKRIATAAQIWTELVHQAGATNVPEADRFAWVAYQGGNFTLAKEWVFLAADDSGAAEWVRAKLALRAGDLANGERHLRTAIASAGLAPQRGELLGELGRVYLARDRPAAALTAWLAGGHWEDAAYVAERVMTLEELRSFVNERVENSFEPTRLAVENDGNDWRGRRWMNTGELWGRLRHLLARRLMRANKADEALTYFPEELRACAGAYVKDVRAGFDIGWVDTERAAAFWRAARVARERGMELLGTELEPDWAIWNGNFETGPAAAARAGAEARSSGTFAATKSEQDRVAEHAVPEKRFHYRYRAAQLAWWAAALMPNDSEETAAVLNEGGGWLKNRDPKAAEAFYQALVIRCGRTELGRNAAKRRWFPEAAKAPDS